jgi:hypothetical protein
MKYREPESLRHSCGAKILRRSLWVGLAGILPLLLYVVFGPARGNPVGLGLLAAVAVLAAGAGSVGGLITMLVEYLARRRS